MTESLDDILNKIEAIFACKVGKPAELAKHLGKPTPRIYEYISQRKHQPSVPDYIKMKEWAAKMTTRIAMAGRKIQIAYRIAYGDVCRRRVPVAGKD